MTLFLIILARDLDFFPPGFGLPRMSLANEKEAFHASLSLTLATNLEITNVSKMQTCTLLAYGILFKIAPFFEKSKSKLSGIFWDESGFPFKFCSKFILLSWPWMKAINFSLKIGLLNF